MLGFLFVVGVLLHFTRLSSPHSVIFDEVHFGKFISAYCCTGSNIFDIHPPHAKLLIAAAAKLGGYDGSFTFERISQEYGSTPIFFLRAFPAIWGVLIPIAFFYLLMLMSVSTISAFCGALVLALDNSFLLQTRVIALDGLLILSTLCAFAFYLQSRREIHWGRQILFWIATGISAGMAVGTKFTGLVVPLMLLILVLSEWWKNFNRPQMWLSLRKFIWVTGSFLAAYLIPWVIHFRILEKPGSGDPFYIATGNFWRDVVRLHRIMLERNATITTPHSDSSFWWQWPTMNKPIYYWQGMTSDVYYLGNPVIWWGISIAFVTIVALVLRNLLKQRAVQNFWVWFSLAGFLVSYLPFVTVKRPLFLYHFLSPLLFALMTSTIWLDAKTTDTTRKRWGIALILSAALIGFVWISPLTFGFAGSRAWGQWVLAHLPKF